MEMNFQSIADLPSLAELGDGDYLVTVSSGQARLFPANKFSGVGGLETVTITNDDIAEDEVYGMYIANPDVVERLENVTAKSVLFGVNFDVVISDTALRMTFVPNFVDISDLIVEEILDTTCFIWNVTDYMYDQILSTALVGIVKIYNQTEMESPVWLILNGNKNVATMAIDGESTAPKTMMERLVARANAVLEKARAAKAGDGA